MAETSMRWVLRGEDRAICVLDGGAPESLRLPVSRLTSAPEDLLTALATLLTGKPQASVRWSSETFLHQWHFTRSGSRIDVSVRCHLGPERHRAPAVPTTDPPRPRSEAGTEVWSTRQPLRAFARAVVKAFDHVLRRYGQVGYRQRWGAPFPRHELEALRASCRTADLP